MSNNLSWAEKRLPDYTLKRILTVLLAVELVVGLNPLGSNPSYAAELAASAGNSATTEQVEVQATEDMAAEESDEAASSAASADESDAAGDAVATASEEAAAGAGAAEVVSEPAGASLEESAAESPSADGEDEAAEVADDGDDADADGDEEDADEKDAEAKEVTQKAKASGATITAIYSSSAFEGDVTLHAEAIGENDGRYDQVKASLDELADQRADYDYDTVRAFDISFRDAAGNELEPGEPVQITIELKDAIAPEEKQMADLVHIPDNGDAQLVQDAKVAADGSKASFETDEFSVYVVTSQRADGTYEVAGEGYDTLQDAINAVTADNQVILVTGNATESGAFTIPSGKSVVFKVKDGATLAIKGQVTVQGKLEINDGVHIDYDGAYSSLYIQYSSSSVVMHGGLIENTGNGWQQAAVMVAGSFEMTGGTVKAKEVDAIWVASGGTIRSITGGTVQTEPDHYAINIKAANSELKSITGGLFIGGNAIYRANNSKSKISNIAGGVFKATGKEGYAFSPLVKPVLSGDVKWDGKLDDGAYTVAEGFELASDTVSVEGVEGSFRYLARQALVTYEGNGGKTPDSRESIEKRVPATFTIADNDFIHPDGKVFKEWNTESNGQGTSYAEGAEATIDGDSVFFAIWETADGRVSIGDKKYQTLRATVDAASDGDTIVVNGDIADTAGEIKVDKDISIVAGADGVTSTNANLVVAEGKVLTLGGGEASKTLTLKGSVNANGSIVLKDGILLKKSLVISGEQAHGSIEGGAIVVSTGAAIEIRQKASVSSISGGTFKAKDNNALYVENGASVGTITGGYFESSDAQAARIIGTIDEIGGDDTSFISEGANIALYVESTGKVGTIHGGNFIAEAPAGYKNTAAGLFVAGSVDKIEGGTFKGAQGFQLGYTGEGKSPTAAKAGIAITGGTFIGTSSYGIDIGSAANLPNKYEVSIANARVTSDGNYAISIAAGNIINSISNVTANGASGGLGITVFNILGSSAKETFRTTVGYIKDSTFNTLDVGNMVDIGEISGCTVTGGSRIGSTSSNRQISNVGTISNCNIENGLAINHATVEKIDSTTVSGNPALNNTELGTIGEIAGGSFTGSYYGLLNQGTIDQITGGNFTGSSYFGIYNDPNTGNTGAIAKIGKIAIPEGGSSVFKGGWAAIASYNNGVVLGSVSGGGTYIGGDWGAIYADSGVPLEQSTGDNLDLTKTGAAVGLGRYADPVALGGSWQIPAGYHMSNETTTVDGQDGQFHYLVKDGTVIYNGNGHSLTEATKGQAAPGFSDNLVFRVDTTAADNVNGFSFDGNGMVFDGWNTAKDGSGTAYQPGDKIAVPEGKELVLYAQWVRATYTVSFDADGGTPAPESQTVFKGDKANAPETDPSKTGYEFQGWHRVTDAATGALASEVFDFLNTVIAGNTSLKALWSINSYQLAYTVDGETYGDVDSVEYGTQVTLRDVPTKEGYTFSGWSTDDANVAGTSFTMPANDVAIAGTFSVNQYTISFDTAGGSAIDPIKQDFGTAVKAPADPTRDGYRFAGWDTEIPQTMPANNLVVTGTWLKLVNKPTAADNLTYNGQDQTGVAAGEGYDLTGTSKAADAGDYTATVTLAPGYAWSDGDTANTFELPWTIAPKGVTVTAADASKVYGEADPELSVTVEGTLGDDRVSYTVGRAAGEDAGTYDITLTGAADQGNYRVSFTPATFTIAKAQMTVQGADYEGVYDGEAHGTAATPSAKEGTTVEYSTDGGATWSQEAPTVTDVAEVEVAVKATNPNYEDANATYRLVVTPKPVTITAQSHAFAYDGTERTWASYDVDGLVGDDAVSATVTGSISFTEQSPVANKLASYEFTSGKAQNYSVTTKDGQLTMTNARAEISIQAASQEWTYDGKHHADASVSLAEGELFAGDELVATAKGQVTNVADTATGNNEVDTFKVMHGTQDVTGNYAITCKAGTLSIVPRDAKVSTESASKAYDGTALSAPKAAIEGLVDGESVTVSGTGSQTEVGDSQNTYSIAWDKANEANYRIADELGTLTVEPNGAEVVLTAASATKVYDGTPLTAGGVEPAGLPAGFTVDAVATGSQTQVGSSANTVAAGWKVLNPAGVDKSANFTNVKTKAGTLTVTAKAIDDATIKVEAPGDTTYNGGSQQLKPVITDAATGKALVEGKDYTLEYSDDTTNAGTVTVTATGIGNYAGTVSASYQINKARYHVATESASKVYDGQALSAPGATVVGLVADETATATAVGSLVDAGTTQNGYELAWDGSAKDANYEHDADADSLGTLAVSKRQVTLTSASATKPYDGSALSAGEVTVEGDGWATGEGASYTVTGAQTLVGASENAFTYNLNAGTKAANYDVRCVNGTLTVTNRDAKYEIAVVANSAEATYDGAEHSASGFETLEYTVDGNSYTVSGLKTSDPHATDAGTYANGITGTAKVTDANGNDVTSEFAVAMKPGTLTISPKEVTVTANSAKKTYGEADPALSATVDGLVGDDTVSYTVERAAGDNAGTYEITPVGAARQGNYTVAFKSASLVIAKAGMDVNVSGYEGAYDAAAHSPEVKAVGVGGADLLSDPATTIEYSTDGGATWSKDAPSITDAGTVDFVARVSNPNYEVSTGAGTLHVIAVHKVSFDADGGTPAPEDQAVVDGGTVTRPVDPARDGYTFAGWFSGDDEYDFDTPVTGDVNLKARWTQNETPVPTPVPEPQPEPQPAPEPEPEPQPESEPAEEPTQNVASATTAQTPPAPAAIPTVAAQDTDARMQPAAVEPPQEPEQPVAQGEVPDNAAPLTEGIDDDGNPLGILDPDGAWSLADLLATVATTLLAIVMAVRALGRRRREDGSEASSEYRAEALEASGAGTSDATEGQADTASREPRRKRAVLLAGIAPAVISVVGLLLTQNFSQPMAWLDAWTPWFCLALVANVVLAVVGWRHRHGNDDKNRQVPAATATAAA